MTDEPDFNAHARCSFCHTLRPVKETITFDGSVLCRDGDCLRHVRGGSTDRFAAGLCRSQD